MKSTFYYLEFRNLLDENLYEITDQDLEINLEGRFTVSRTKMIHQHHLEGIFAETEFKH